MRFIDANVFIYAILKPKIALPEAVQRKKTVAKDIFLRVNANEPVTTTTVHLSEVANVLEDAAGISFASDFLSALVMKSTINVEPVTVNDYRESIILARKSSISINDALAILIMERQEIGEIYTFDRHFSSAKVKIVQK
jgi:predicted nucleic acid-binding protein